MPEAAFSNARRQEAEPGAGGVVLSERGEVLLLRYAGGGWTFPKGHLEDGERDEDAALREVREETGVTAHILARLSPTRYTNARGVRREIHWFLMRAARGEPAFEPIFEEGGFYPPARALELLSYPEDQELLREALGREAG